MANKVYEETHIQDIADAIREKNGTQNTYLVSEMGNAIRTINGSGDEGLDDSVLIDSGKCGDNVVWSLYNNGELVISGSGAMYDYDWDDNKSSFYNYRTEIKNTTIKNGVTTIGNSLFYECELLVSITIPDSVISIGRYAFECCYGLTDIIIPDSVSFIGDYAFSECESLKNITISNSVTSIYGAFSHCISLTNIVIPNSVTNIDVGTFSECYNLISVFIPDSVTNIGTSAFRGCQNLTTITIPNSVTNIDNFAFSRCTNLTSVIIPNSVVSIGTRVFYNSGLEDILFLGTKAEWNSIAINDDNDELSAATLHCEYEEIILQEKTVTENGVVAADEGYDGLSLVNVDVPMNSGDNEIAKAIIDRTLTNITDNDLRGITTIGMYAFRNCKNLINIIIPDSVTRIYEYAFDSCTMLTSVTIPNSVTYIGTGVFSGCTSLTNLTIPDSVITIGNQVFSNCTGIKEYDFSSWTDIPKLPNINVFNNIASDCVMKVPAALYDEMINATNWSTYAGHMVAV